MSYNRDREEAAARNRRRREYEARQRGTSQRSSASRREGSAEYYTRSNAAKAGYNKNTRNNSSRRQNNEIKIYKQVGLVLASILILLSLVFVGAILNLNLLPANYVGVITLVLSVMCVVITCIQLLAKGKALVSKGICVFLIIVLSCGSFYIFKTSGLLSNIMSTSGVKIDEMVTVVRIDDSAEVISDAKDYKFGVQYNLQGDDVREAIAEIEEEVGQSLDITEYSNLSELSEGLLSEEVDAIIYNIAYESIIEEDNEEYPTLVKVLYSYEKETEVEEKVVEKEVTEEPFCIYVSGIDVYGSISKTSRSDVNILIYVNPNTRQILQVTTPRDYYVTIPGVSGSAKDKLTHAGIYGVNASKNTLAALYSVDIDYYARVNFTSLINIVDALGGINVYSEQAFTALHSTGTGRLVVNQGMNYFNGEDALVFSRERYNVSGGDNQRGKNQQAVIEAMIEKATSSAIITGAMQILSSVSSSVDTDMPQSDLQALIKNQISEGGSWDIKSMAATGTGDRQYCYSYSGNSLYVMQPNYTSIEQIKTAIQAMENGEWLTDEMVAQ